MTDLQTRATTNASYGSRTPAATIRPPKRAAVLKALAELRRKTAESAAGLSSHERACIATSCNAARTWLRSSTRPPGVTDPTNPAPTRPNQSRQPDHRTRDSQTAQPRTRSEVRVLEHRLGHRGHPLARPSSTNTRSSSSCAPGSRRSNSTWWRTTGRSVPAVVAPSPAAAVGVDGRSASPRCSRSRIRWPKWLCQGNSAPL